MLNVSKLRCGMMGFTLIEMMVVMAVLSILLAIAAPSFTTYMRNAQIQSISESVMAGINLARSEAIRRNTRVSFWMVTNVTSGCALSDSGNAWVVSLDNPEGRCDAGASPSMTPRIVQVHTGGKTVNGVNLAATTGGGAPASCITFNAFGGVEATCSGGGAISEVNINSLAGARGMRIEIAGGSVRLRSIG